MRTRGKVLVVCGVIALGIFLLRSQGGLRRITRGTVAPYQRFTAWAGSEVTERTMSNKELMAENKELRKRIVGLETELLVNRAMQADLEVMRAQLGFSVQRPNLIPAEVISIGGLDGWVQRIRLGKGKRHGLTLNAPVLAAEGLVGRIVELSDTTADVLLITDVGSAVACTFEPEIPSARGVLTGGGRGNAKDSRFRLLHNLEPLRVEYLNKNLTIPDGAVVVTSGLGGVYPRGLRIGKIIHSDMHRNGLYRRAEVVPFVDFTSLRYVVVWTRNDVVRGER